MLHPKRGGAGLPTRQVWAQRSDVLPDDTIRKGRGGEKTFPVKKLQEGQLQPGHQGETHQQS